MQKFDLLCQQTAIASWMDLQQSGKRQSPIHILTANTVTSEILKPLDFVKGWAEPASGTYENSGQTVSFRPNASSVTSLQTHTGEYVFDNFHYHWGEKAGCGSEHLVDGNQYDMEIHFVFKKVNNTDPSAGDAISVLGIFGEVSNGAEIKGIWEQVAPTRIQQCDLVEKINGIFYSDLLPPSRDYFHYEGSLTTPGYDEVVQWFVLREPIQVPALYLDQLRNILDAQGKKITRNYRELQNLNGRFVYKR